MRSLSTFCSAPPSALQRLRCCRITQTATSPRNTTARLCDPRSTGRDRYPFLTKEEFTYQAVTNFGPQIPGPPAGQSEAYREVFCEPAAAPLNKPTPEFD